jgi:glycosyltransferase involved in cell wall biosynthesis
MPSISVVIASKVGPPFVDRCLRSVESEAKSLDAEVIVVAAGAQAYASRLATEFPWARIIHAPEIREVPALRRRGVEEAAGELVAVIEEHCSAAPDWLRRASRAHAGGEYGAVGGPIVDDDYGRRRDWVTYFIEYNGALPPAPNGESLYLNDANIVYRRQVLTDHLDLLDEGYWPMTLHPTLLAEGTKFLSVPDMVVHHLGPWNYFYYLHQRFLFSRAFGGVRAQSEPASRRLAYLLGAPLIPAMLLIRIARTVWQKRCRVPQFVLALPLIVPALIVLVAGEWVGYLIGPGDSLSKVE